ncbi:MAG: Aminodeoxychorismate lyase [Candidatus Saccharibacteria bacterium]|nr:Aminodeoxychorismate lyase [Candidatus Saccharibacteria bacterium]
MNDFLPPKRPVSDIRVPQRPVRPQRPSALPSVKEALPTPPPVHLIDPTPPPLLLEKSKRRFGKKLLWWIVGIIILAGILTAGGAFVWYKTALRPVSDSTTTKVRVQIVEGTSPSAIGTLLEEKHVIRSQLAFDLYTRLSNTKSKLQAGTYNLSPSQSTEEIVTHLVSGNTDDISITFLPGATLAEDRTVLIKAGYSAEEVDAALGETYDHPLFAGKPASADLEGYIYGETYSFPSDATVSQILLRTFDQFYSTIQKDDLVTGFKQQGLDLYQGITLASIIQREVSHVTDQKQVAQVFFKRLAMGMALGSDVTYQYAAKKLGVTPSPSLDSPYNTRINPGLPPGPIASPGETSLQAVAAPATGDYLYFLSGDDDITYFARTDAEHEANIRDHCKIKCLVP